MDHFERLKQMYEKAPIHNFYENIELIVSEKRAEIQLPIDERYFHAGMTAHGSVYFKLMDDAAYFAAQSVTKDYFLVTSNFSINLLRPIKGGKIHAIGELDFASFTICTAKASLYDEKGRLCGTGHGQFVKSKLRLDAVPDYID